MSTLSVRRPLALLAVLGMVATLLFAVVGTASAATAPSSPALFSACPDNADIPDAGFTDVPAGSFFNDSVSCLKYYAVTEGTTPTTYDPGAEITRAQMAAFLYRLAPSSGVVLDSTPPDAGFTDIDGLSVEFQTAINALADAGIVKGKTATTYEPGQPVLRQQMALFLTRFLGATSIVGPGGTPLVLAATDMAPFTDIDATTFEANVAINQAWDLGIAKGTTATTYAPLANVNRGQMALFLERLMGHVNTRPLGVNIQANPTEGNIITPSADEFMVSTFSVTTRKADNGNIVPDPNTVVDLWAFITADWLPTIEDTPFLTDGSCNLALEGSQIHPLYGAGSDDPCMLNLADPVTDPDGNVFYFETLFPVSFTTMDMYAWTGPVGAKFNVNTTDYSMVTLTPTRAADGFTVTKDPSAENVLYGTTVTYTIQVTDEGAPIAEAGWTFGIGEYWETQEYDGGWNPLEWGTIDPVSTVVTDASGQATYTKTMTDPNATAENRSYTDAWFSPADPYLGGTLITDPTFWYDTLPYPYALTLASANDYVHQFDGAENTVTGTVTDQYGDPMESVGVWFFSSSTAADADGIGTNVERFTNASGEADLTYNWTHGDPAGDHNGTETVEAWVTAGPSATDVDVYWVDEAATGDHPWGMPVLVHDVAQQRVIGESTDTGEMAMWSYYAGDDFSTGLLWEPISMGEWVIQATVGTLIDVDPYDELVPPAGSPSGFNISW